MRKMRNSGFTLLEVMVAIAIFSMIGLGVNQTWRTVIDAREQTELKQEQFRSLFRTMQFMENDFAQITHRKIRDEYGDTLDPFVIGGTEFTMELTKSGWLNPGQLNRSNLQRVAYALTSEGQLNRIFWLVLDRSQSSVPVIQHLMEDVTSFEINVLDTRLKTSSVWPPGSPPGAGQAPVPIIPAGVEVILELEGQGEVRKVFSLISDPT